MTDTTETPTVTPDPDRDGVILHLPEITYLDTQTWAVDVGLTAEGLAALRAALEVPAAVEPPADRAALRDRIRRAVCEAEGFMWNEELLEPDEYGEIADAVLAVLPEPADQAAEERIEQAEADAEQHARNTLTVANERESYRKAWKGEQQRRVKAEAAVARVRRLHDALDAETALTSPDGEITRGTAARKIAAALDGWTDPAELRRMADETPAAVCGRSASMATPCSAGDHCCKGPDEEAHVVADGSDDPEHVDDCPGCAAATLTGHVSETQPVLPKAPPMDPVHILGIGAAGASQDGARP